MLDSHGHELVGGAWDNIVALRGKDFIYFSQIDWLNFELPVFIGCINVAVVGGETEASEDIYTILVTGSLSNLEE